MMEYLKIGNLHLKHRTILAPMASLTDIVFRRVLDEIGGVGLMVTELISAEGLRKKQDRTLSMIRSFDFITPQFIQLYGSEPESFVDAVKYIEAETDFSGIDINMGCPVRKIIKKRAGAALLKDPKKIGEICRKVRKVISIPFTVKIRLGYEEENVFEILKVLENEGVDAVTVHFRLKTDGYSSEARWEYAERIKERSGLRIIGNGNILNRDEALERLNLVDGIMIGRGAISNPFIFAEIQDEMPGPEDKKEITERIMALVEEYYPPELRLLRIKAFTKYLALDKPEVIKIKYKVYASKTFDEVKPFFRELDF
jgi:nifR3 family TIM-barrel protein